MSGLITLLKDHCFAMAAITESYERGELDRKTAEEQLNEKEIEFNKLSEGKIPMVNIAATLDDIDKRKAGIPAPDYDDDDSSSSSSED